MLVSWPRGVPWWMPPVTQSLQAMYVVEEMSLNAISLFVCLYLCLH